MNIFISYASEDRAQADELAVRLRTEGHTVFLDRDDLPEGEGYDARIREAIAACDLYLFLISPQSVKSGRYTQTELKFAREQFPNPRGRVLPVMLQPTPFSDIPPYLSAVTVLQAAGNLVAETVAEVDAIAARRARAHWLRLGGAAIAALALAAVGVNWLNSRQDAAGTIVVAPPCRLTVAPGGTPAADAPGGLALDITTPAGTTALMLGSVPTPFELGPFEAADFKWSLLLRGRDGGALGQPLALTGCPASRAAFKFGDGHELVIEPR